MKVVYNFIYADPNGKQQEFQVPVNVTKGDVTISMLYDLGVSYMNRNGITGTLVQAIKSGEFCSCNKFTSSTNLKDDRLKPLDDGCRKREKVIIYNGKFEKENKVRVIQTFYVFNKDEKMCTDNLLKDFKEFIEEISGEKGWKFRSIKLSKICDVDSLTDEEVQGLKTFERFLEIRRLNRCPKERMVWARISDRDDNRLSWIPAIVADGAIYSSIGELIDPDSKDDLREFDDCPIPEYKVVKITNENKR